MSEEPSQSEARDELLLRRARAARAAGDAVAEREAITRLIVSLLYSVSPTDIVTFTGMPLLLAVAALVGC